jgi:hypothetical protein
MLKIFQGQTESPNYRLVAPADGQIHTITVAEEVDGHISRDPMVLHGLANQAPRPLE